MLLSYKKYPTAAFIVASAALFAVISHASAQTAEELQVKIDARAAAIRDLEKVIQDYQTELAAIASRGNTLSAKLSELNLTLRKLQANISLTEDKIGAKNLEIQALSKKIGAAKSDISDNRMYVTESLRRLNELGGQSLPQILVSGRSLSDSWTAMNRLIILESDIGSHISDLKTTKTRLETSKNATERAKAELVRLQAQLTDEKKIVTATVRDQKKLLAETKNSEAAYQRLLKEKEAEKDAFEAEISLYESQIKLAVDASKLPKGANVLSWPLDSVRITQYFGSTPFATANPQVYSGKGHNGIDLGASIGTPIKAALTGTVVGTGDTDLIYRCESLGKWVLIRHPNGLSTLYAHMSLQTVPKGATIDTGQVIGYSGNTGYSTGPHLHFGVYASSGIEIKQFVNSRSCKGAVIPIAATQAYLNPLSYLPKL